MAFETRRTAGALLAAQLHAYAGSDAVVLGRTRGGVVVGHAVAQTLHLPFDILVIHPYPRPGEVTDEEIQHLVQRDDPAMVGLENRAARLHLASGAGR